MYKIICQNKSVITIIDYMLLTVFFEGCVHIYQTSPIQGYNKTTLPEAIENIIIYFAQMVVIH